MSYEDFVKLFCKGQKPALWQENAIKAVLLNTEGIILGVRMSGRTTLANWLREYFEYIAELPSTVKKI